MKNKTKNFKKITIISTIVVLIIGVVISLILLIPKTDNVNETSSLPESSESPEISDVVIPVLNEEDKKQEFQEGDRILENADGTTTIIKSLINVITYDYSSIINKEKDIVNSETVKNITTSPDDYLQSQISQEKINEAKEEYANFKDEEKELLTEYDYLVSKLSEVSYEPLDIDSSLTNKTIEVEYLKTIYGNDVVVNFSESDFKNNATYYQVAYEFFVDAMRVIPKSELKEAISPREIGVTLKDFYQKVNDGDMELLFNAVMNDCVCINYHKGSNHIFVGMMKDGGFRCSVCVWFDENPYEELVPQ